MKKPILTEYEECCLLADYCRAMKITFSHLAQSTYTTSWPAKRRNGRMGVNSGVPDYIILLEKAGETKLLFCEMKRVKGGVISDEQQKWTEKLNKVSGCMAVVCKGFEEAHNIIKGFYDRQGMAD